MTSTLLSLLPPERRARFGGYLVLIVVSTVLRAIGVVLIVPLVAALFGDNPAEAWPVVGALTVAVVAGWIVDAIASRVGFDLGFTILDHAQRDVSAQVARIPLRWFGEDNSAAARRAIASNGPDLVGLLGYQVTPLVQSVLLPFAIGIGLVPVAWQLGAVSLFAVPLLLGALWASGRISRRADEVAKDSNSALTARILEFARTQAALRAARRVEPERSQVGTALATQHGATTRLLLLNIPGQILFSVASQITLVLLAGTTAWLAVNDTIGVPEAVALIVVVVRFLEPFGALADLAPALETSRGILRDIRAVIDAPEPVTDAAAQPRGAESGAAGVELRGVSFGYGHDTPPILDGFDVEFRAGEVTAVVGPSGSGKSTLLGLVAGLEKPASGQVLVGGVDRGALDPAHRPIVTSMVFQQPYLFAGTIRENVLAGNPGASEEELTSALRLSRVEEFAERLPEGLDTLVGDAGTALSGGERQRVSIARALLKPSSVLLVDEGTSALDTENEAAVVAAITDDPQQRTRVVVTHRLSTIAGAARVLFLEAGRIVEDGSVEELLAAQGRFAEFWAHQHDAAGWRIASDSTRVGAN
ncbi:ABC transporter ATP-binding protein [Nocardia cyriacigeorgica]|uniref:ABC transporter ATP-binding protein n=1 Tax=Nocardia cyriacigeorgica TaxID=135487 RepID=A0A6P1D6L8_9NOCA|nr:ABC transporter ATP-binding protein [Nocardia cyriacigeorgica]NEW43862.1 ABC transporter ATP-binding protein [Nocardia cyriacigeorgica]